jgi:hypothetical protein
MVGQGRVDRASGAVHCAAMVFGALVIGDEILVGKRQDKHLAFVIEALTRRGLRLAWCEYLGDDPERLTATLACTFRAGEAVLSFGGIGATPDDHTRQCAAAALGVPLVLHSEAERELRARFGAEITPQRLEMGVFPASAAVIANPVNRVAGLLASGSSLLSRVSADGLADAGVGAAAGTSSLAYAAYPRQSTPLWRRCGGASARPGFRFARPGNRKPRAGRGSPVTSFSQLSSAACFPCGRGLSGVLRSLGPAELRRRWCSCARP